MRVARQSQLPIVIKVKRAGRAGAIEKATVATTCCSSETVKVEEPFVESIVQGRRLPESQKYGKPIYFHSCQPKEMYNNSNIR